MKPSGLALLLVAWSVAAFAQGTVNFVNINSDAGLNAPVYFDDGVTKLGRPIFTAELLAGPALNQMQLVANTGVLSGAAQGYFQGNVVTLWNVAPGEPAWLVVQVWALPLGSFDKAQASLIENTWAESAPFQVKTGGDGKPPSLPAPLVGLISLNLNFSLIDQPFPKPGLGFDSSGTNNLSLTWSEQFWRYELQQSPDLKPNHWITITNGAILDNSTLRVTIPKPTGNMFYRLVRPSS